MRRLPWMLPAAAGIYYLSTDQLQPQGTAGSGIAMPESVSFRLLLGVTDAQPTSGDGSVELTGGTITSIRGWRFAENDSTDYKSSWKLSRRRGIARAAQKKGGAAAPMEDNGVVITPALTSPASASYKVATPFGSFTFSPRELPYGESRIALDRRARVERVPSSLQLATSAEEQDHPALAQSGDDVYLAFVDFTHGARSQVVAQFRLEPKSFGFLTRATGGDQVKLMGAGRGRLSPGTGRDARGRGRGWKQASLVDLGWTEGRQLRPVRPREHRRSVVVGNADDRGYGSGT